MSAVPTPARSIALALIAPALATAAQGAGPDQGQAPPVTATVVTSDGSDWLRLVSGEWLKGELIVLDRGTVQFDSAELDDLEIDWADVVELRTAREFTLLLEGREQLIGRVQLLDGRLLVEQGERLRDLPREAVVRIVPGEPRESNFWSGKLTLGSTVRRGNTDQLDLTTGLSLLRRTARSRLTIDWDSAYSELDGESNSDNQRLRSRYDWFLNSRLFLTPLGFELYRDEFQNIELRASPYTGLGYAVVDRSTVEWDLSAALGYRVTRYASVETGSSAQDESATGILGTTLSWRASSTVDVDFAYSAEIGLEDVQDTNQLASAELSVDLWWDFDLDLRLQWNRVGQPAPDSDGQVPKKDDLLLAVGLSWSF
ncbi:DUF481 domain-containing protein [Engelhardtia mirabilis]|uniref:DUF481 domain-containing protein n=1 Tax=Engelhardtia mirabilis TaxID=2528011 RepID=A0A518BDY7_9BACT|nr:hypothetical protein Pla133_02540 [Planctomycetes bacterium Pla133]QDU99516.1 hypothetical protein Pla86_02540 [Planctomycetes bacterium Pla86]